MHTLLWTLNSAAANPEESRNKVLKSSNINLQLVPTCLLKAQVIFIFSDVTSPSRPYALAAHW